MGLLFGVVGMALCVGCWCFVGWFPSRGFGLGVGWVLVYVRLGCFMVLVMDVCVGGLCCGRGRAVGCLVGFAWLFVFLVVSSRWPMLGLTVRLIVLSLKGPIALWRLNSTEAGVE